MTLYYFLILLTIVRNIIFIRKNREPTFALPKQQGTPHAKTRRNWGKFAWSATCSNCVLKLKLWPKTKSNRHRHEQFYYLLTFNVLTETNQIKSAQQLFLLMLLLRFQLGTLIVRCEVQLKTKQDFITQKSRFSTKTSSKTSVQPHHEFGRIIVNAMSDPIPPLECT